MILMNCSVSGNRLGSTKGFIYSGYVKGTFCNPAWSPRSTLSGAKNEPEIYASPASQIAHISISLSLGPNKSHTMRGLFHWMQSVMIQQATTSSVAMKVGENHIKSDRVLLSARELTFSFLKSRGQLSKTWQYISLQMDCWVKAVGATESIQALGCWATYWPQTFQAARTEAEVSL